MKDKLGKYLQDWRIDIVLPHIEGRLLDIGCGMNELVERYPDDGIGIDVYQWGNVDILVEDSSDLPFDDRSFDTVTVLAALNHIPNRTEVLKEIHRVLKENGKFLMTMIPPAISRVWHILREPWDIDQHERGMVDGEVYGIRQKEVRRLLEESGFSIYVEKRFMLGINCFTGARKSCR